MGSAAAQGGKKLDPRLGLSLGAGPNKDDANFHNLQLVCKFLHVLWTITHSNNKQNNSVSFKNVMHLKPCFSNHGSWPEIWLLMGWIWDPKPLNVLENKHFTSVSTV